MFEQMPSKNALRRHEVAPFVNENQVPTDAQFMVLSKYISDISDATDETMEAVAFYDGDGTPEHIVQNVAVAYDVEGFYLPSDPAQKFIADMKLKRGAGRFCWHRVTSADGTTTWVGPATVSAIVAGSGAAGDDETFSCTITYNKIPHEALAGV
ncbi:MAG: phage tail protein [Turicibacter sp.]|nr:phage tail protein [Turicibacter sp.]